MKRSFLLRRVAVLGCRALWFVGALQCIQAQGQPPDAGQSVFSHPYLGIDVDLPNGWEAQAAATGFLLAHPEHPEAIAVLAHDHDNQAALRRAAARGLHELGQVELRLQNELTPSGENGLAGTFEGIADGEAVRAHAIFLLSPYKGGVTVLVPLPEGEAERPLVRLAERVASGIRFQPRVAADPLDPWKERLVNCRLTHLPGRVARPGDGEAEPLPGERVVLDLCDTGHFQLAVPDAPVLRKTWTGRRDLRPTAVVAEGVVFRGDWALVRREGRAWLRLDFPEGARREFVLSLPDGSTFLDDLHVYRSYADALRIEDLPDCP